MKNIIVLILSVGLLLVTLKAIELGIILAKVETALQLAKDNTESINNNYRLIQRSNVQNSIKFSMLLGQIEQTREEKKPFELEGFEIVPE